MTSRTSSPRMIQNLRFFTKLRNSRPWADRLSVTRENMMTRSSVRDKNWLLSAASISGKQTTSLWLLAFSGRPNGRATCTRLSWWSSRCLRLVGEEPTLLARGLMIDTLNAEAVGLRSRQSSYASSFLTLCTKFNKKTIKLPRKNPNTPASVTMRCFLGLKGLSETSAGWSIWAT